MLNEIAKVTGERMKELTVALSLLFLLLNPAFASQDSSLAISKNNEGVKCLNRGDYRGAIKKFDESIEIEPRYGLAIENRAIAWKHLKHYKKALNDYDLLVKLRLENAWTFSSRADIYAKLKDYKSALSDYDRAIDANQSARSLLLRKRAKIKLKLRDKIGAKEDLERAAGIDKLNSE
ncbi:MAG TPA: hypothetical protein PKZ32_01370 [Candidatus Melainabacteria bacterium]|nr:hypothetical protein [Candidatus Melainabacteria bacterium]